jgi:hypothetical protein
MFIFDKAFEIYALPYTGSSRVSKNSCFIPEQNVFKKERFVYQFYRLDSGIIASFRKRSSKDQTNYKVVQQRKAY